MPALKIRGLTVCGRDESGKDEGGETLALPVPSDRFRLTIPPGPGETVLVEAEVFPYNDEASLRALGYSLVRALPGGGVIAFRTFRRT